MSAALIRKLAAEHLAANLGPMKVEQHEDGLLDDKGLSRFSLKNGHVLVAWIGNEMLERQTTTDLATYDAFVAMVITGGVDRSKRANESALKIAALLYEQQFGNENISWPDEVAIRPFYHQALIGAKASMVYVTWKQGIVFDTGISMTHPRILPSDPPLAGIDMVDENGLPTHSTEME